jgi:hypothetical protein
MPRKVTIRPNATDDGIAAELVNLLEEITADGTITDDEVRQLNAWLDLTDRDAPAFTLLRAMLDQILADGKITAAERKALHKAIERILPPEMREQSKAVRSAVEMLDKERAREAAAEQRQHDQDEHARNRAQFSLNFMVMGVAHERRDILIERHLMLGQNVSLVRELGNPHDDNAVLIRIPQGIIGYVPREHAAELAPLLDNKHRQIAYCSKILQGKRFPIPVVQLALYRGDSAVGVETPAPAPFVERQASSPPRPRRSGCATTVILAFALTILLALLFRS